MLNTDIVLTIFLVCGNLIWLLPNQQRLLIWIPKHMAARLISNLTFILLMVTLSDSLFTILPKPYDTQLFLWALLIYSAYTAASVFFFKIIAEKAAPEL